MEKLYKEFKDRIEFIGINKGDKEKIEGFIKKYDLSFPVAHDLNEKVLTAFKARIPTYVLIDTNGKIRYKEPDLPESKHLDELIK
ncbi:MAG: TlpA family protein disulfide reductase [Nitrospirae bacterium]|nr:TlpA family protein disulfide reductase [Nitrospirota bacterium]